MTDPKELEQLIELGKNAALLVGVVVASAIGAWRSIKAAIKPITLELTGTTPQPGYLPPVTPPPPQTAEEGQTLKATTVRIEDRVRGLEDQLKSVLEAQKQGSHQVNHFEGRIDTFSDQMNRFGDQLNLLQEQVNTIHKHLLSNGRPH